MKKNEGVEERLREVIYEIEDGKKWGINSVGAFHIIDSKFLIPQFSNYPLYDQVRSLRSLDETHSRNESQSNIVGILTNLYGLLGEPYNPKP